jgi:hypothetical protein
MFLTGKKQKKRPKKEKYIYKSGTDSIRGILEIDERKHPKKDMNLNRKGIL